MAQMGQSMGTTQMGQSMGAQSMMEAGGQMVPQHTQGSQPNYAMATSQKIPGLEGRREGGSRRRARQEAERNTSAEEKEFASLTTKKNLCNVQNKLERAMADLTREVTRPCCRRA